MNRSILFDSPFLLGFEHTRALAERAAKAAAESYPPYNVEDRGDGRLRITLAVAGFTPDQLQVTLEDRQLVIAGRRDGGKSEDAYLHRGIAARGFLRTFVLADGVVAEGAVLEHGLLHIDLAQPEPERLVQRIPIRTAEPATVRSVQIYGGGPMTPTVHTLTNEAFAALGGPDLVYVRPVKAAEILASVPSAQVQGFELDPDQTLYAVHRADGERLAVLTDKQSAVAAALAHELAPVSVH